MKWIKQLALAAGVMIIAFTSQSQTIRNITFPLNAKKEYRPANEIEIAGKDAPVILLGNGQTGASLAIRSCSAVTINGGFTVQAGASLSIGAGECAVAAQKVMAQAVNEELVVYPNPAGNMLTIYLPGWDVKIKKELTLTDLSGKKVMQQPLQPGKTELDVSAFQRGAYLLIISGSDNTQQTRKLMLR